jgi:hypothetical protein
MTVTLRTGIPRMNAARTRTPRPWVRRSTSLGHALVICGALWPCDSAAQARTSSASGGRFEITGSVGWTGASEVGSAPAILTGNGVPTGTPVTLFDVRSQVQSGPRFEGRLAWRLSRMLALEGGLAVTRTRLRAEVSNDFEGAPPLDATARLTEYAIEGGLVIQTPWAFAGGRGRPFMTGGAGYLRQAHEGSTLIDTGQSGFAGGGVMYIVREARQRAFIKTIGVRGEARVNVTTGGFEVEDDSGARVAPSATAGLFVRF